MKFMSRIVERNETVMEKIVNTEEKLCQKWMFRNLLVDSFSSSQTNRKAINTLSACHCVFDPLDESFEF